jgi:mRNA-degrading endonuclease RelE of RelBE toxin-antitoxin system
MRYESLPPFDRDFKKLLKRFRTLNEDFATLKQYHIETFHNMNIKGDDPVEIQYACGESFKSYKIKKFACKSLPGRGKQSGLRVIYVYQSDKKLITFIEIYFKADKENEDKRRLKEFISGL